MATLSSVRVKLNRRLGRQYNDDDDGKALLNDWINEACRFCWESLPLGFNVTSTATIPTITNDRFTLPTAAMNLLEMKQNMTDGSYNNEVDLNWFQEGREIQILNRNETPDRIVYHSFWTELTTDSETVSSYIPVFLIIELAAYFAGGETKDTNDNSPIQINKALKFYHDWANRFSYKTLNYPKLTDRQGVQIGMRDGPYGSGPHAGTRNVDETKGWA